MKDPNHCGCTTKNTQPSLAYTDFADDRLTVDLITVVGLTVVGAVLAVANGISISAVGLENSGSENLPKNIPDLCVDNN